jgi:hypothetical protein
LLVGFSYKFVLQNSDGVLIQTLDNIYPILQNAPASAPAVPTGGIILWSGSTGSIPATWYLCDGTNGTPDLRNSFIVGAGSTYAVNATGGTADAIVVTHTHTATSTSVVTDPQHSHVEQLASSGSGNGPSSSFQGVAEPSSPAINTLAASTGITVATTTTNANAGTSGTNANLPPYYALAYIMKG